MGLVSLGLWEVGQEEYLIVGVPRQAWLRAVVAPYCCAYSWAQRNLVVLLGHLAAD